MRGGLEPPLIRDFMIVFGGISSLVLAAITLAYAMASEAAKRWFFRREGGWGGERPAPS